MVRDEDLPKFLKGVRALMVVQVRDLCEGPVANGTPVGFLPCVCPNVIAQIVFLRKALVTGLAPVRLHPRMGAHVNLHVALLGERLWTESTFKGSFTCVCPFVVLPLCHLAKCPITVATMKWPLTCMCPYVVAQDDLLRKRLVAKRAEEVLTATQLMVDQVTPLRKPLTARATLVGLLGTKAQTKVG